MKKHYYWVILIACCFLAAMSVGICLNTAGLFFSPMAERLGVGSGASAMQATLSGIVFGLCSPLVARLFEKANTRMLLLSGIALTAASTALMGLCTNIQQFYILGIIRGASHSFYAYVPITMLLNNWFERHHGTITGVVLSFTGIAGVVLNPLLSGLIENAGLETAYLVSGGIILVFAVPSALLVRFHPSELGMFPYGRTSPKTEKRPTEKNPQSRRKQMHSLSFVMICTFGVFTVFTTGLGQFLPGYAEDLGTSLSFGATLLSVAMVGNIIFKFVIGVLCDRLKPVAACTIMLIIGSGGIALMLFGRASWAMLMGAAMFGSSYAVGAVGVPLVTRYTFGAENYAYHFGFINVVVNIGGKLPFAVIGFTYDLFGSYNVAFVGCIIMLLLSILMLQMVGRAIHKGKHPEAEV